jgi:hypothetical protein
MLIKRCNIPAHMDIENEIASKNGLVTFTIRLKGGNIVDLVTIQHENGEVDRDIEQDTGEKFEVSPSFGEKGSGSGIWHNNSYSSG